MIDLPGAFLCRTFQYAGGVFGGVAEAIGRNTVSGVDYAVVTIEKSYVDAVVHTEGMYALARNKMERVEIELAGIGTQKSACALPETGRSGDFHNAMFRNCCFIDRCSRK